MLRVNVVVILSVWSMGVSGCAYRLLAPNRPFKQSLRIISPDASLYSVRIDGDVHGTPYPVASDGKVTLDVRGMSRGCDVYVFNVIKIRGAQNPFERRAVHLLRGTEVIRQMSLNEIGKLPLDTEGYRLLSITK